ncbi:patatin-like phospholipase family protein [Rhodococcus sp. NPDC056960]|uniref:patatin-like phospholipase family protein n=1 Tax=Rhodococcus sp. NPDC056960 TaxID=3345982 RepID=UPI00362F08D5
MSERALVLGGGGSTGNAWEIGVVAGLCDAGLDVTEADLIIGTSAGSTAAAQLSVATTAAELLAAILAAAPPPRNGPVGSDRGGVPSRPVAALEMDAAPQSALAAAAGAHRGCRCPYR